MRVIGVVDLRGRHAVRAYAGRRDEYQPIGDAVDRARMLVDRYGVRELYVADLDAIETAQHSGGGPERPALHATALHAIGRIAEIGVPMWLDAGVSSVAGARHVLDVGAAHVVVGLETLESLEALGSICEAVGGSRVAFSLDLRNGQPVNASQDIPRETPERLARHAAGAGAGSVIVIDLARVGTRLGVDVELIGAVRKAAPGLTLIAGGGVRDAGDLERLGAAGCDGALVATAIGTLYPSATR
jgi:phosphoribosylformimino-5-aminoimidazole carboxamide ribotide isomerase